MGNEVEVVYAKKMAFINEKVNGRRSMRITHGKHSIYTHDSPLSPPRPILADRP
jgi:hypothetical protein